MIPLSLYIHIPWCIKKCPYCDFNSYALHSNIPEQAYVERLLQDLSHDLEYVYNRPIRSIFFGGGTPSLFSPRAIELIINEIAKQLTLSLNIEITLEANPGTIEHYTFQDYRTAGINRISLGVQSFNDNHLKALGRVHTADETKKAIETIVNSNFNSYNLDIMYGLPNQTFHEAMEDLKTAITYDPPPLSWYHLTIEPNTLFHHKKPTLPIEDIIVDIQSAGDSLLNTHGLKSYEVSAYSMPHHRCQHNLNYWMFGDYLGIGAGAHAKITDPKRTSVRRFWKTRYPKDYLNPEACMLAGHRTLEQSELPLEFMMNALRLSEGFGKTVFTERTGLDVKQISHILDTATAQGLLYHDNQWILPTPMGKRFLNDLITLFM
jgi:putative oxygen-independent coproporphyrinogen III oxidase